MDVSAKAYAPSAASHVDEWEGDVYTTQIDGSTYLDLADVDYLRVRVEAPSSGSGVDVSTYAKAHPDDSDKLLIDAETVAAGSTVDVHRIQVTDLPLYRVEVSAEANVYVAGGDW